MEVNQASALIRKHILDGTVWNDPDYEDSIEGLAQAFQGPDRADMVAASAELLLDPDVRIRSGIATVLSYLTPDLGAEWLTTLLEQHSELFVGVEPVGVELNQPDLEKEIIIEISDAIQPGDTRSLALLRKAAQNPSWGFWILPTLARIDSEWLCAHPKLVPHQMISVLLPLNSEQREKLVLALAPWPEELVDQIPPDFWRQFPPLEARHLYELMSDGLS